MISAACHDVIRFAIARKITTLESHATSGVYSYPSPSLKSGHFTCQFNRTLRVLPTRLQPIDCAGRDFKV
jgi:hypothetical protein